MILACFLVRKSDGVRNVCLTGVLLIPAVAALHAVVLASVHVDGTTSWSRH